MTVRYIVRHFCAEYASKTVCFIAAVSVLSSCTSPKTITYFQRKNLAYEKPYSNLASSEQLPVRVQPNDVLAVVVNSLSEESNALFTVRNLATVQTSSFPGTGSGNAQPLGFPVSQSGEINLPLAGQVMVAGMTLKETEAFLEERLTDYVKSPTVKVRLLNHKFTVLGEVNRPGIYNMLDQRTTLTDVIGIAGDLTLFGRRDNVMLVREVNSKRQVIRIDLASRQALESPYYYIENNDVIYVESRPSRITASDRTIQLLPVILSTITTSILLYNVVAR